MKMNVVRSEGFDLKYEKKRCSMRYSYTLRTKIMGRTSPHVMKIQTGRLTPNCRVRGKHGKQELQASSAVQWWRRLQMISTAHLNGIFQQATPGRQNRHMSKIFVVKKN